MTNERIFFSLPSKKETNLIPMQLSDDEESEEIVELVTQISNNKFISSSENTSLKTSNLPRQVEGFGKFLLESYGWREGTPIGKTNAKVVPVIELQNRPNRLGLGAKVSHPKGQSSSPHLNEMSYFPASDFSHLTNEH